jgi:molecular chaperone GrpE
MSDTTPEASDCNERDGMKGDPSVCAPEGAAGETDALDAALMEVAQWKDAALRAAAELDNYRKRMAREMQEAARYANAGLLESLLPVLDNFDYGLQAAVQEGGNPKLLEGLHMVLRQIQSFLRDHGVEEIEASGVFDPNLHDAMMQQASEAVPEGSIIAQTRRGYRLRERLLRPASVILSSGPAAPPQN